MIIDRGACVRRAAFLPLLAAPLLLVACASAPSRVEAPSARIARLLRETPLVDGHNDLVIHYHQCRDGCPRGLDAYDIAANAEGQTDIARWRKGGLGAQLLNSGWHRGEPGFEGTLKGLAFVRALVARHSGDLVLARTSADVRRAHAEGRIAILLALENPGRLGANEAEVRRLAAEGVRSNLLAYDEPTEFADGHAGPARHGGLSERGREMVGWMQEHGILVDLSHASADTARDVLEMARAPVIFSHSNAAALADVQRNVPDDVLRRLPANGGIVMATFVPYFATREFSDWLARGDAYWEQLLEQHAGDRARVDPLMDAWERDNPQPPVGVADIADHVEHIRDVAGIDHVGIAGDFDGIAFTVKGLEDVSTYPRLFEELARRGWSDADLRKLAGENFLRVLDAADAAAQVARPARDPVGEESGLARIPVRADGLVGTLVVPADGRRRPGVLWLGGGSGGIPVRTAETVAAEGYAVLALAYFAGEGLPADLEEIPLEYFGKAIAWMKAQPAIDSERLAIAGVSRGSTLALLLPTIYPEFDVVVAFAPSHVIWQSTYLDWDRYAERSSHTFEGRPLPFVPYDFSNEAAMAGCNGETAACVKMYELSLEQTERVRAARIPVEKIGAPVLLFSGKADTMWPSSWMSDRVIESLDAAGHPFEYRHVAHEGAGHCWLTACYDFEPLPGDDAAIADTRRLFFEFLDRHLRADDGPELRQ